jgi:hypothetical protein
MTAGRSDDEPMLSQPNDDNAPMISGRGTKVIADARGAYLAGNLKALIEQLDEVQRLRFRQIILFKMFAVMEEWLALQGNNPYTTAFEHLRSEPNLENAQSLVQLLVDTEAVRYASAPVGSPWTHFTYSADTHWSLLIEIASPAASESIDGIFLGGLDLIIWSAGEILRSQGYTDNYLASLSSTQIHTMVDQWQLEVAWFILQGKVPPPFELPT